MTQSLDSDLDLLSLGELTPAQALRVLRQLHAQAPATFAPRAYAVLGSAVLRLLSSRRDEALRDWTDVIRQASALVRTKEGAAMADKLLALSDLTAARVRMAEANPVAEVLGRPHCREVLDELRRRGGQATREDIADSVATAPGNLIHILANLEFIGLATRDADGTFRLTAEGELVPDAATPAQNEAPGAKGFA